MIIAPRFIFSYVRPSAQVEALDGIVQRMENEWITYQDKGGDMPIPQVCIKCWGTWIDGTCICQIPQYWPINHAIRRAKAIFGEGSGS